jgi:hypothetical protein
MSNLRLYNRGLSAAEILQSYNSRKSRFGLWYLNYIFVLSVNKI